MYIECLPWLGTVLSSGDTRVNNTKQCPCPHGVNVPLEEGGGEDKRNNF